MLRTILFLIAALLILPFVAVRYDAPLGPEQWAALMLLLKMTLGVALTCFAVSELTRNCSQVDKLWSIVPVAYVWVVAAAADYAPRLTLMLVLTAVWAARLTFNFWRRRGYSWVPWQGEEDYRWAILRQRPFLNTRLGWAIFNLFFISLYQNGLILLFTLPTLVAWQGDAPMNWLDAVAAVLMFGAVVLEFLADQQQYDFQTEKYRRIAAGEPLTGEYAVGFVRTGLWARARHPNYAAEQTVWLAFYLFSVAATGRWVNWSLAGGILLMLLFLGSADFSEKVSAQKYPLYAEYQRKVARFWPKFW